MNASRRCGGHPPPTVARVGPVFIYAGVVRRVIDADTLEIDVDLGFRTWLIGQHFRLAGCNCHEAKTDAGRAATQYVTELLPAGTAVTLRSIRDDKYGGRMLADVFLPDGPSVVELMIRRGWAARWDGRGPKPLPPWPREDSQR